MGEIEVFSPAKINLFLAVLGRMESGFHELVSLVAPLDYGDRLVVESGAGPRSVTLECDDPSLPIDGRNLAYAAASRFLERYELDLRVRLRLEKRTPHGAGLGGGSSNASAVLRGLATLAGIEDAAGLEALAAELGSDCPLFLRGEPVVMRGRGELLSAAPEGPGLAALRGRKVLIIKPSFSIGTVWAYRTLAATSGCYDERGWAEGRLRDWAEGRLPLEGLLHNAFERVAFAKYPAYGALADEIEKLGAAMLLSGSGSSCFLLLESWENERQLRELVRGAWGHHAFVTSAIVL